MYNKNLKTILFASLIVAMILPFSGMMMAEAAPNENADDKVDRTKREAPEPPSMNIINNAKLSGKIHEYKFNDNKDGFIYPHPAILTNSDNAFGTVIDTSTSRIDGIYSRNEVHDTGLTMADATALYAPTMLAPNKSGLEIVTSYVDEGPSTGTLKRVVLFDMSAGDFISNVSTCLSCKSDLELD